MSHRVFYISSNNTNRSDCEKLSKKDLLGKGSYGYQVCKNLYEDDCNYVLKVIMYDELSGMETLNETSIKQQWINEVLTLEKLNRCQSKYQTQFVPIIYDSWFCKESSKTFFYIVMERFDGNLNSLIKIYKGNELLHPLLNSKLDMLTLQLRLIHRDCSICLNDIKLDNILYKKVDKDNFIFVFADTGKFTTEVSDDCKKYDTDKFLLSINEFKTMKRFLL